VGFKRSAAPFVAKRAALRPEVAAEAEDGAAEVILKSRVQRERRIVVDEKLRWDRSD
jgi:hypothetical protein